MKKTNQASDGAMHGEARVCQSCSGRVVSLETASLLPATTIGTALPVHQFIERRSTQATQRNRSFLTATTGPTALAATCRFSQPGTLAPSFPSLALVSSRGPGQSVLGAGSHGHGSSPISQCLTRGRSRPPQAPDRRAPSAFRSRLPPARQLAGHVSSAEAVLRAGSIPLFCPNPQAVVPKVRELRRPYCRHAFLHTPGERGVSSSLGQDLGGDRRVAGPTSQSRSYSKVCTSGRMFHRRLYILKRTRLSDPSQLAKIVCHPAQ